MFRCPYCSHLNSVDNKFCADCGKPIQEGEGGDRDKE